MEKKNMPHSSGLMQLTVPSQVFQALHQENLTATAEAHMHAVLSTIGNQFQRILH
jgi:hypothetical protein